MMMMRLKGFINVEAVESSQTIGPTGYREWPEGLENWGEFSTAICIKTKRTDKLQPMQAAFQQYGHEKYYLETAHFKIK